MAQKIIEAEARITAVDATGPVFDNVAGKFNKLSGALNSIGGSAMKFGGTGVAALNNVGAAADKFGASISKMGTLLASGYLLHKITELRNESLHLFAKLDDIRRMQAAVAGGTTPPAFIEQQERLGRGANKFTEADFANAQLRLQRRGLSNADVTRVVEGATDFAVAMDASDLGQVAKDLVEAAEGLKELGQESPAAFEHLKGRLVKLHQLSDMSEEVIHAAYAAAGPTVASTGLSEAAFAAMMTMAYRQTGEDPGEILRMFLTKLMAPGKEGIEALGAMGIDYSKYTTEGQLTPDSFKAFMARHDVKVTERKGGMGPTLAAMLAGVHGERDLVNAVVDAAGPSFRDKHGEIKEAAVKQLAADAKKYYAEHIARVDVTGLIAAIEAKHPTLDQLEPLIGTRRAAKALPFLTDQKTYDQLKAQFENIPEGIVAATASTAEGGLGGAGRRSEASKEGVKTRLGQVWAAPVEAIENATTRALQSLSGSDQAMRAVSGLSAWVVSAGGILATAKAIPSLGLWLPGAAALGGATVPFELLERAVSADIDRQKRGGGGLYGTNLMGFDPVTGAPLEMPAPPHFTTGDIRSAVGMPTAKVEGSAELSVNVKVEPSDSFVSRITSAIRNEINVFGGSVGTAGSTGLSMPEAVPGP